MTVKSRILQGGKNNHSRQSANMHRRGQPDIGVVRQFSSSTMQFRGFRQGQPTLHEPLSTIPIKNFPSLLTFARPLSNLWLKNRKTIPIFSNDRREFSIS
jgi:hypothetical protein